MAATCMGRFASVALVGTLGVLEPRVATANDNYWASSISKQYLDSHGKWISQTFVAPQGVRIAFKCWNNHDKGQVRLWVINVETRKPVADTGFQDCNWTWREATGSAYRRGEGLRMVLATRGKRHTTEVYVRPLWPGVFPLIP